MISSQWSQANKDSSSYRLSLIWTEHELLQTLALALFGVYLLVDDGILVYWWCCFKEVDCWYNFIESLLFYAMWSRQHLNQRNVIIFVPYTFTVIGFGYKTWMAEAVGDDFRCYFRPGRNNRIHSIQQIELQRKFIAFSEDPLSIAAAILSMKLLR